jgi:hypothetical protein
MLRDDGELLASELVTNALLRTASAVTIQITVGGDRARVEVEDDCPVLPVAGLLDPVAACGRGLVLLDRLSHEWGVTVVPGGGKKVWFELIAGPDTRGTSEMTAEELLDVWATEAGDAGCEEVGAGARVTPREGTQPCDEGGPTRGVRVDGVDTDLLNATKSHLDDLVRDLALATEAAAAGGQHDEDLLNLGCRLGSLVVNLVGFRNEIRRQALQAVRQGAQMLTLEMDLPLSLRRPSTFRLCRLRRRIRCRRGFRRWRGRHNR